MAHIEHWPARPGGGYNAAMCGFAGELIFRMDGRAEAAVAEMMASALVHRGPDEAGLYCSPDGRCVIGFRRLSIIDLELSHQPMTSPDGAAVVAFNGEIYNYRELRAQLTAAGVPLRTKGDTEVLPALWRRGGLEMLSQVEGMFALAIYDQSQRRLLLARDRLGEKPLWYVLLEDRIVFASEVKALLAHPRVAARVDPRAVAFYLSMGYVPAPMSIWRDIRKLPPAHYLVVDEHPGEPQPYWQLPEETQELTDSQAVEAVRERLALSVRRQMVADVPLGALLSGGLDSSIVAALMCKEAGRTGGVRTFTAGFAESSFDERPFAAAVARHLGTEHTQLTVSAGNAAALLDALIAQYDEPFADSSALAMYLVCQAARGHVKVALTGDGGDECFAGYDRYRAMALAEGIGAGRWALMKLAGGLAGLLAPRDERSPLRRLARFAAALDEVPSVRYFHYRRLFDGGQLRRLFRADLLRGEMAADVQEWFTELYEHGEYSDEVAYAQRHDLLTYLPDDLLVKSDIASMAHSLELRCPMLDHRLVELGLGLPARLKVRAGRGKVILRQAFADLLPAAALTRGKQGFGVPISDWLKGELNGLLRSTLLEGPLVEQGWLNRPAMLEMIAQHESGRGDHRHRLWALLWLGRWMELNAVQCAGRI